MDSLVELSQTERGCQHLSVLKTRRRLRGSMTAGLCHVTVALARRAPASERSPADLIGLITARKGLRKFSSFLWVIHNHIHHASFVCCCKKLMCMISKCLFKKTRQRGHKLRICSISLNKLRPCFINLFSKLWPWFNWIITREKLVQHSHDLTKPREQINEPWPQINQGAITFAKEVHCLIVNSVAMYEEQLTKKSLLNQATFCCSN